MATAIDPATGQAGLGQTPMQKATQSLGQDDFLRLLTTQLQNQDPMQPMDNGEFLGQMAQFSTVSGIQDMQASMSQLASSLQSNQILQASMLVGRDVMVASDVSYLTDEGTLQGGVDMPAGGQLIVDILDSSGQVVRNMDLGVQGAGVVRFGWDGTTESGEALEPGAYGMQARMLLGNQTYALDTLAVSRVNSVDLSSNGLMLDVRGLGSVSLNDVWQIG